MNRLTKRDKNEEAYIITEAFELQQNKMPQIIEKLAQYEDLEEQGLLIKLPRKVGDKVYIIINHKIFEEKLIKTSMSYETEYYSFDESSVGQVLFFDRKEAESALEKMEGEYNA